MGFVEFVGWMAIFFILFSFFPWLIPFVLLFFVILLPFYLFGIVFALGVASGKEEE